MSRWMPLAVLVGAVLSFPAVAQDSGAVQADSILYVAQKLLLLLGMAFAGYWAYSAFNARRRSISATGRRRRAT